MEKIKAPKKDNDFKWEYSKKGNLTGLVGERIWFNPRDNTFCVEGRYNIYPNEVAQMVEILHSQNKIETVMIFKDKHNWGTLKLVPQMKWR